MKACCLAGSSLRDIASGLRCSSPRRCTSAISPERLSETTPNSCSIHAPGRPRQGVADPRLQRHLLLQGQLAGATPVLEAGQAIDPVRLEKPVPRPDRIVVDQQHPTNILAAHPAIQQHQRVRPTGQTMLSQPVPSQLGQVLPFLRCQKAAANHGAEKNPSVPVWQAVFSTSHRVAVYIAAELARDPAFDFYCLVDSTDGVRLLAERLATRQSGRQSGRALQVMVEIGSIGGRTGCRTDEAALAVARAVKQAEPLLSLRGVEGYEGIVRSEGNREEGIRAFLDRITTVAVSCAREDLFADGPIILSAGGSAFYDMVAERLGGNKSGGAGLGRETLVLLRSGCYLTHDSKSYETLFQQIRDRMPAVDGFGPSPMAALEVWAYVQSRPQRDKAILTDGKRDISYDVDLPVPTLWFRPGLHDAPVTMPEGVRVTELNDQHAHLSLPPETDLKVGDMVAFGISHPCT